MLEMEAASMETAAVESDDGDRDDDVGQFISSLAPSRSNGGFGGE